MLALDGDRRRRASLSGYTTMSLSGVMWDEALSG